LLNPTSEESAFTLLLVKQGSKGRIPDDYFQGLKIYFHDAEYYFQALKIIFRGDEIRIKQPFGRILF